MAAVLRDSYFDFLRYPPPKISPEIEKCPPNVQSLFLQHSGLYNMLPTPSFAPTPANTPLWMPSPVLGSPFNFSWNPPTNNFNWSPSQNSPFLCLPGIPPTPNFALNPSPYTQRDALRHSRLYGNDSPYKTALCQSFKDFGACKYGTGCRYAHGVHELRLPKLNHPKYKTVPCRNYETTGQCPYGLRCQFKHAEKTGKSIQTSRNEVSTKTDRCETKSPIQPTKEQDAVADLDCNGNAVLEEAKSLNLAEAKGGIGTSDALCDGMQNLYLEQKPFFKPRIFRRRRNYEADA